MIYKKNEFIGGVKVNYCKKCGNELKPGQEFCTNCGETVEFSELSHDIDTKQRSQNKQPTFLNKKRFWILAIIIVILLAALVIRKIPVDLVV